MQCEIHLACATRLSCATRTLSPHIQSARLVLTPSVSHVARRLTEEERASVLLRAKTGGLQTNLVLERARSDGLFDAEKDGKRASCWDLTNLKNVDKKALEDELELLADLEEIVAASQTESLKMAMKTQLEKVALIDARLKENIKVIAVEEAKKCGYNAPVDLITLD